MPLNQPFGKSVFTMVTYEVHDSITQVLDTIEHLYQDVKDRIDRGEEVSFADVRTLAALAKVPNEIRNREILKLSDLPTIVPAKKWGVSQARVSQIRLEEGGQRINTPKLKRKSRKEPVVRRRKAPIVHPHAIFR
jgi:hypothetical protein